MKLWQRAGFHSVGSDRKTTSWWLSLPRQTRLSCWITLQPMPTLCRKFDQPLIGSWWNIWSSSYNFFLDFLRSNIHKPSLSYPVQPMVTCCWISSWSSFAQSMPAFSPSCPFFGSGFFWISWITFDQIDQIHCPTKVRVGGRDTFLTLNRSTSLPSLKAGWQVQQKCSSSSSDLASVQ